MVSRLIKVTLAPRVLIEKTKGSTVISKKVIAICATVGVAISGFALAMPAHSEPVSPSLVIVGSDTIEDVVNALVNGYTIGDTTIRSSFDNKNFGSYDASGSLSIVTTPGGVRFGRPNGSGDGRKALLRSIDGALWTPSPQLYPNVTGGTSSYPVFPATIITGQIDMARSSSLGTPAPEGVLLATPFGRDAMSYVYQEGSAAGIESLTQAELKQIFEGAEVFADDGTTRIKGLMSQVGSGTGKDWVTMIGASSTLVNTAALAGTSVSYGQEHDASSLAINTIAPMSVTRWIAYNTGGSAQRKTNATIMGSIGGVAAVTGACSSSQLVNKLCPTIAPNQTFYSSAFGRDTYIVVEYARRNESTIAALLDPTDPMSLTYTGTLAGTTGAIKAKFGFLAPSSTTAQRISG